MPVNDSFAVNSGPSIDSTESRRIDKRSSLHGQVHRAFSVEFLTTAKPVLSDQSAPTPHGKPMVIARG